MLRAQTSHPLDPLSATEITVVVATVRAAGATPEVVNYTNFFLGRDVCMYNNEFIFAFKVVY